MYKLFYQAVFLHNQKVKTSWFIVFYTDFEYTPSYYIDSTIFLKDLLLLR